MFREMKPQTLNDGSQHLPKSNFSQSALAVAKNKTEMKVLMKAGIIELYVLINSGACKKKWNLAATDLCPSGEI